MQAIDDIAAVGYRGIQLRASAVTRWGANPAVLRQRLADRALTLPFGRQGTGWEVAYAALFLISNESSYVNAHTLFLDAGHMAGIVRG